MLFCFYEANKLFNLKIYAFKAMSKVHQLYTRKKNKTFNN